MTRTIVRFVPNTRCGFVLAMAAIALAADVARAAPHPIAPSLVWQNRAQLQALLETSGLNLTLGQARALLQQSSLSPAALRRQALAQGLDPTLVDQLSADPVMAGVSNDVLVSQEVLELMLAVGLIDDPSGLEEPEDEEDEVAAAEDEAAEVVSQAVVDLGADLEIFGSRVFRARQRDPVLSAPPGESYVLGPSDRLLLYLTGDVEEVHQLPVTREGVVFVPRAGRMVATGLTLAEFEDRLETRLRTVYSGVGRNADARTRFSVSLGRVRTIQIYVGGAVYSPGSYVVSSLATLVDAIYVANGPTPDGSYRSIRLVRSGEELEVDLYPYITSGLPDANPRLREGDVVHVPWVGDQVAIRGMVRNPGIYEVLEGQGIAYLIKVAGGLLPTARADHATVNRILAPEDRRPMVDRVRLDVPLSRVLTGEESFPLEAGDRVEVLRVQDLVRGEVIVQGAVWGEGTYEWEPDMRLADLFTKAGGLRPDALLSEVLIARGDMTSGVRRRVRVDLTRDSVGPLIDEGDEVTVYSEAILRSRDSVSIAGFVAMPGKYAFIVGATAGDLILQAGGFAPGAFPWSVDIGRRNTGMGPYGATTLHSSVRSSVVLTFRESMLVDPTRDWSEEEVVLRPNDEVIVRSRVGYRTLAKVMLLGQFRRTGAFVLETAEERLTSIVDRAGGLLSDDLRDIELRRGDVVVGIDFLRAIEAPNSPDDPILQDGDTLVAPLVTSTVKIEGQIVFPTEVTYVPGMSVGDILDAGGGTTEMADIDRLSVSYPDGSRALTTKALGLFRSYPKLRAGARVFVPTRESDLPGFDWGQASAMLLSVASTVATLILAINSTR